MGAASANLPRNTITQAHYHAFLSHNGADKPAVRDLAAKLEERGLACWLDEWNLIPGNPWQPAIEEALGQCDTCLVFFGPHGLGPWHNEEMRLALQRRVNSRERKLRVLPVILPGGQRAKESELPGFLQGTTWVEFRRSIDEEDALHRLVCGIKCIPPGRRPGATILEGECPYLGLKTFQPEDAPLFFGRTAKAQELIDRLRNNFGIPKEARFLALIGASGSGKSSLALAGLIPSIQRGELPASAKWPLVRCRPGDRPWENLQIALSTNQQIALHMAALPALIIRPEDEQRRLHLTAQLALNDQPENQRLFILIDQFEEIFTLCNDERARSQLIDNVLYATNVAGGRTIVVLTMRADFYGQCASYPGLRASIADHQSLIGPLSKEELREAIESPAQLAGGELESGLIELLLADMKGQAGALPFLEHALFKLWEMRAGRRLTARAYTEMGQLGGALDAHAEAFFTKTLSVQEQSLCRQLLVDLVHPGEGAADTKKCVSLDDVAPTDAARAVLKKLADARLVLVTTDRDDRPEAAQAELAHEALISGWRRLGEWVNENREKSRLKERLLDSGREWQRSTKKEDFLYRGAQLATAQEIFGSSEELPKIGREFLEASIAERKRAQEEKQREQRGRQRLLAAAAAVFALLAVVASVAAIGFWQKGEAERQKVAAERQALLATEAQQTAEKQAVLARAAEDKAHQATSQVNVFLALNSSAIGNYNQELAYLAKALKLNGRNSEAGALIAALLTQKSWPVVTAAMKHDDVVYSAQFSADGQRVVTASADKTARVWDAATGKALSEPMKHDDRVYSAQFSADGQRVVTASADNTAGLWDIPTITRKDSADDANLLADLAEATAGLALQAFGQTEILAALTPDQVKATREKIATKFVKTSSNLTPLQRLMKWSVSDRRSRTISPLSEMTVAEWVENRIKDGTLDGLRAAVEVDPTNARLAAHFGEVLAHFALEKETDPNEARRTAAEADFQTGRALRLASDNDEVSKLRAEVVQLLKLSSQP
jgi:energy-coupling factor transporter ATP-binding protein EcfA2